MFSPDDYFVDDHDLRNYYPSHQPSSASILQHSMKLTSNTSSPSTTNHYKLQQPDSSLGSSINSTPNRISIREANEHMNLLHQRVADLEDIIRSQGSAMNGKEADFRRQVRELRDAKERQIHELSMVIAKLEGKNQELEGEVQSKTDHLQECHQKLILLDQFLASSLPSLEQMVSNLKQFSLNNADLIQLTSTEQLSANKEPAKECGNMLSIESAVQPMLRTPANLSPAVRSPVVKSPVIRSPAAPGVAIGESTAHLISATSALINSSIVDVQSTDSGNASDSSRTNSYGQVLDELKEAQQQHLLYSILASPARRRSLEKQKPIDESSVPIIVETSAMQNELSKDIDITEELNRSATSSQAQRKIPRKLPHTFGKKDEAANLVAAPITSQLKMSHSPNESSPLSPSINHRVIKSGASFSATQNHQLMTSYPSSSSYLASSIQNQLPSTYSSSITAVKSQPQVQLVSSPVHASTYRQYQMRNPNSVANERNVTAINQNVRNGINNRIQQQLMMRGNNRNNYNYNNNSLDFSDEDDYDDDDQDEYGEDDAPPPPAPPPSKNTSNISLPSLQAPKRYLQPSF